MTEPRVSLATIVLDCRDAQELADFYVQLLGWKVKRSEPDWVLIEPTEGGTHLAFQAEPWYEPPVWPEQPGALHKMIHLDLLVDDLAAAGDRVASLGATLAEHQPQEGVRVYLDPAGHPFCLFTD